MSYGFSTAEFNQIIIFNNENELKKCMAVNPNMVLIIGGNDHTKAIFPGVFIVGLKASLQRDK